jgi:hypothetical protein
MLNALYALFAVTIISPAQQDAYVTAAAFLIANEPRPTYCVAMDSVPADSVALSRIAATVSGRAHKQSTRLRPLGACGVRPDESMEATYDIQTGAQARILFLGDFRQVSPSRAAVTLRWYQGPLDGEILEYQLTINRRGSWRVVKRTRIAIS